MITGDSRREKEKGKMSRQDGDCRCLVGDVNRE